MLDFVERFARMGPQQQAALVIGLLIWRVPRSQSSTRSWVACRGSGLPHQDAGGSRWDRGRSSAS